MTPWLGRDSAQNVRSRYISREQYEKMCGNFEPVKIEPETIPASSFEMQMEARSKARSLLKGANYS